MATDTATSLVRTAIRIASRLLFVRRTRSRLVLPCLFAAFGLTGCSASAGIRCKQEYSSRPLNVRGGDNGFVLSAPAERMSGFHRPRTPQDSLPVDQFGRRVVAHLYEDVLRQTKTYLGLSTPPRFGHIRVGASRLLLNDVKAHVKLYAAPTTRKGVCWEVIGLLSGCETDTFSVSLERGRSYNVPDPLALPTQSAACLPLTVAGIVPDGVISVSIVSKNRRVNAYMGANSFFYQATDQKISVPDVTAIELHYADHSTITTNPNR